MRVEGITQPHIYIYANILKSTHIRARYHTHTFVHIFVLCIVTPPTKSPMKLVMKLIMQDNSIFESNENDSTTETDESTGSNAEEETAAEEQEEDIQEGKFPVDDLSQIVEVNGQRTKLTAARKKWRQWLLEKCRDKLKDGVLASAQKERVNDLVSFINESPKSIWMGMVGARDLITTTWLRREVTSCHNKYYFMLFVGCFKLIVIH